MKNCKSFEKQLIAYLHGELNGHDIQTMETHLESCASCQTELEAQRATLDLLGASLETAHAPERLVVWRKPAIRKRSLIEKVWFSVQLKAVLSSTVIHVSLFLLAGMLVVFTVVKKEEKRFAPPRAVERPKMKLQKPKMKLQKPKDPKKKVRKTLKLNPTMRTETKMDSASMSDIQLPEMSGKGMGFGDGVGGFEMMPDADSLPSFGTLSVEWYVDQDQVAATRATVPPADVEEQDDSSALLDSDAYMEDIFGDVSPKPAVSGESGRLEKLAGEDLFKGSARARMPAVFNPYMLTAENAFSTFSIDVDTASYGLARKKLLAGGLPDVEMVRTEEFINSFDYDYRPPAGRQTFAVHSEMAPSPFRMGMDVLKVGIKGRRIGRDDHRGAVLTLVIDTSGSMATPERLGLVKQSLALLIDQLNPTDEVAIIQFGGEARLVQEHTPASEKAALLAAINGLQPSGPTQFDKGLALGYQLAKSGFRAGDSNRIMILSDGVANLGELDPEAILEQVAEQRKKGIYLSVLGFGAGTYDDDMLERLANKGDGMYAYIDTLDEARHLLVDQLAATLHVIASDVKIQIEFNPARVLRYRQMGYENRQLTKEQFRDDTVDAGEVGSGQSVTALYDVELNPDGPRDEPIATVYVRYRRANNGAIEEISNRVMDTVRRNRFEDAGLRFKLAVCTAEFAERLRRSPYTEGTEMSDISGHLLPVAGELDLDKQVQELMRLILIADRLEK